MNTHFFFGQTCSLKESTLLTATASTVSWARPSTLCTETYCRASFWVAPGDQPTSGRTCLRHDMTTGDARSGTRQAATIRPIRLNSLRHAVTQRDWATASYCSSPHQGLPAGEANTKVLASAHTSMVRSARGDKAAVGNCCECSLAPIQTVASLILTPRPSSRQVHLHR